MRWLILATIIWSSPIFARVSQKGMLQIRPDLSLYVEHYPAAEGKATLFLLNGLTYSTENWQKMVEELRGIDPGLGLVLYDMVGMGHSLMHELPFKRDYTLAQQVQDLHDLIGKLDIPGKKIAVGESYGGAAALDIAMTYPDDFDSIVAMAPYIEPLPDQDQQILQSVKTHKLMFPMDPRNDDELYDYYLRLVVYSTYPLAEPSILEKEAELIREVGYQPGFPVREAIFRLAKGAKTWNAIRSAHRLPNAKLHLMAAADDSYVKLDRINLFWNSVPTAARASLLLMHETEHKIPEVRPREAAAWLANIANGNPKIKGGVSFSFDPHTGEARSGNVSIPLSKEPSCESALRKAFRTRL
jgi:pimeloyl-ACP methyl ester carboxylesterase